MIHVAPARRIRYQVTWRRVPDDGEHCCSDLTERDIVRRIIGAIETNGPVTIQRIVRTTGGAA